MKRKVDAEGYTCDACGNVQLVTELEELRGLSGTAFETTGAGGWSAEWFACKRSCVGKAVARALDGKE